MTSRAMLEWTNRGVFVGYSVARHVAHQVVVGHDEIGRAEGVRKRNLCR